MRSRQTKHLLLCVLIAVLLGVTAQQGFGDAWVSQYTFASAPIVKTRYGCQTSSVITRHAGARLDHEA